VCDRGNELAGVTPSDRGDSLPGFARAGCTAAGSLLRSSEHRSWRKNGAKYAARIWENFTYAFKYLRHSKIHSKIQDSRTEKWRCSAECAKEY